jgi:hypothetical protein
LDPLPTKDDITGIFMDGRWNTVNTGGSADNLP